MHCDKAGFLPLLTKFHLADSQMSSKGFSSSQFWFIIEYNLNYRNNQLQNNQKYIIFYFSCCKHLISSTRTAKNLVVQLLQKKTQSQKKKCIKKGSGYDGENKKPEEHLVRTWERIWYLRFERKKKWITKDDNILPRYHNYHHLA